jgi:hypothetical protein
MEPFREKWYIFQFIMAFVLSNNMIYNYFLVHFLRQDILLLENFPD